MSTTKQRDGDKERFWRTLFLRRLSSKVSVAAFCQEQGVSEASFYAWRRILKQRDGEGVHLVPVQVVTEETRVGASVAAGLELILGNGRVLRIGPAFDAVTLARLLSVLEEGRP